MDSFILTSSQRITKVEAVSWNIPPVDNQSKRWLKDLTLTFNTGLTKTIANIQNQPVVGCATTTHTYTIQSGYKLDTFYLMSGSTDCSVPQFYLSANGINCNAASSVALDLSSFSGMSQSLFTAAAVTYTFQLIDTTSGYCSDTVTYSMSYTPSSATPNLIKLVSSTSTDIAFAASNDIADANTYAITIIATRSNLLAQPTSATTTFSYIYNTACSTATITATKYPDITTSVLLPSFSETLIWVASGSSMNIDCGLFTVTFVKSGGPATVPNNPSLFLSTDDSTKSTLNVNPLFSGEIGVYSLVFTIKLTSFPTQFASFTTQVTITSCVLTSVTVVQSSDMLALAAQSYGLSSTGNLNYGLTTTQTPGCGYVATFWAVSVTGPSSTSFWSLDTSAGVFSVSPTTDLNLVGHYTIQITQVTLNGLNYLNSQLLSPSSFTLDVTSPCQTTTIYPPSTIADITFAVWDAEQLYPASLSAVFPEFTDQASIASGNTALCTKIYSVVSTPTKAGGISLTTFQYVSQSKQFRLSSQAYNQIGTYTVTLKGEITSYSSQSTTVTFKIIVTDPCLTTSLIIPSALPLSTSVLLQASICSQTPLFVTRQVQFDDSVSFAWSSNICGQFQYTLTTTAVSQSSNLDSSEIYINQNTGLVSLYTANSATIGLHSATVTAELTRYTSKQANYQFVVEIQPKSVYSFQILPPAVADQVYLIGQSAFVFDYDPFLVEPACFNPGLSSIEAYTFDGPTLPTYIDFSSVFLTSISDLEWLRLDQTASTLTIQTEDSDHIGIHQVVLVQRLQDYPDLNNFTTFLFTIKPAVKLPIMNQPPYFEPALSDQILTQCDVQPTSKLWSYKLPTTVDPNQSTVTTVLSFNQSFFAYDNQTQTLRQIDAQPFNQTVSVTLQNTLNLTATYTMKVRFVCWTALIGSSKEKQELDKIAKQGKWPVAYIKRIEPNGLLHLKFRQKMKVPDHPELIQNETITLNETIFPILKFELLPGKYSSLPQLKFNWTYVEFVHHARAYNLAGLRANEKGVHAQHSQRLHLSHYIWVPVVCGQFGKLHEAADCCGSVLAPTICTQKRNFLSVNDGEIGPNPDLNSHAEQCRDLNSFQRPAVVSLRLG